MGRLDRPVIEHVHTKHAAYFANSACDIRTPFYFCPSWIGGHAASFLQVLQVFQPPQCTIQHRFWCHWVCRAGL